MEKIKITVVLTSISDGKSVSHSIVVNAADNDAALRQFETEHIHGEWMVLNKGNFSRKINMAHVVEYYAMPYTAPGFGAA
jgi:hypothetical protein